MFSTNNPTLPLAMVAAAAIIASPMAVLPDEASLTDVEPPEAAMVRPAAASTSVVVTDTVWSASESKSSSDEPSLTDRVTVEVWLPSSR